MSARQKGNQILELLKVLLIGPLDHRTLLNNEARGHMWPHLEQARHRGEGLAWGEHVSPSMTADRIDACCNHLVTTEVATCGRV